MIACKQCGRTYEDDAEYCNFCQITLDERTSLHVYDQESWQREYRLQKQAKQRLLSLVWICLVFVPFLLVTDFFPILPNIHSQMVFVGLFEVLAAYCVYCHKTLRDHFVPAAFGLGILSAILLPAGLLLSAGFFYLALQVKRN